MRLLDVTYKQLNNHRETLQSCESFTTDKKPPNINQDCNKDTQNYLYKLPLKTRRLHATNSSQYSFRFINQC